MSISKCGWIAAIVTALMVSASTLSAEQIFVSTSSSGTVDGITFSDEDIILYDTETDTWSRYFDGSDVGLSSADIDAIHLPDDGSILMSFTDPVNIAGIGWVDDSDIVRFVPTSTGVNTSGSFEFFFDGSDVGLSENWEDVDAIGFIPDGRLVVSVIGDFSAGGVSRRDEDLVVFNDTSLGDITRGSWAVYFDGSDVGLGSSADEDVKGTWIDSVSGRIYLNTLGNFSVSGVSGAGGDIFRFAPTSLGIDTLGSYVQFWIGSQHGLLQMVDAISIRFPLGPEANDDTASTPEDTLVNIDVLFNDTDPSGGTLSVDEVSQGANGTVTTDGTSVTYTPNADFNGADNFDYTINDGNGRSDTATVNVTVDPVNDPPVAVNDSASTAEGRAVTIDVVDNDSDIDGDGVTIESVSQGSNGTVSFDAAAGTVTYTPDADFSGQDSFTYTITDTAAWYSDAQYLQRKRLRLDGSRIMGTLTDFPVLVSFTDAELAAAQANGYDLIFTDEDGTTKLDYEREDWDPSTGAIVAWVRFPILTAGVDKVFYVYFDKDSELVDQQNPAAVWDASYRGVWHLNETVTDEQTSGTHTDSAGSFDGSQDGNAGAVGKIAGGQDFDGANDFIDLGTTTIIDGRSAFTISAWVRLDTLPGTNTRYGVYARRNMGSVEPLGSDGSFAFGIGDYVPSDSFNVVMTHDGTWHDHFADSQTGIGSWQHIAATYDGVGTVSYFLNGNPDGSDSYIQPSALANLPQWIGVASKDSTGGHHFNGIMDEVRVSTTDRSAAWIETSHNNQNEPLLFVSSVGPTPSSDTATVTVTVLPPPGANDDTASTLEDVAVDIPAANLLANDSLADVDALAISSVGPASNGTVSYNAVTDIVTFTPNPNFVGQASFTYAITDAVAWYPDAQYLQRKRLRLDGSRIMGTLTDFPVLVSFTDGELTAAQANGYDLVFTDEDGTTKLDYEREDWDPSTGAIVAWVRFPILTAGVDKDFYIYFDKDSELVDQQNAAGVWNASYRGIWHLNEAVADEAVGGTHVDSALSFDGTQNGNAAAAGRIAGGQDFDGSDDFIDLGTTTIVDGIGAFTVSAWVRLDALPGANTRYGVYARRNMNTVEPLGNDGSFGFAIGDYVPSDTFNVVISHNGTWHDHFAESQTAVGAWQHIAATYDGVGTVRYFLKGKPDGSDPYTQPSALANVPQWLGVASKDSTGGHFFNGIMDEVRVSTTDRSAAWIETSYNNQNEPLLFLNSVGPAKSFNLDTATVMVTVTNVNDAPMVSAIEDQSIAEGASFATINLDDYVSDPDNTDAEMTWTFSGNTDLAVSIDVNRVATINVPDADWNGTESITFRATDPAPGLLFAETSASFTVSAVNDAPVVSAIADQNIAEGAGFATINLDDYVSDPDNTDAQMTWTYSGNTDLAVSIDINRVATISVPDEDWNGSETITFRATDPAPGLLFDETAASFTVSAVNDLPTAANNTVVTDEDTAYSFQAADFNFSDVDGDTLSQVQITTLEGVGALQLNGADVTLNQEIPVAQIVNLSFVPAAGGNGSGYDSFGFKVHDGTAYSAASYTMTVDVTDAPPLLTSVLPPNDAPAVSTGTFLLATFSEAMDAATINSTTFELRDALDSLVPAGVSYNPVKNRAILTPANPLAASAYYNAVVKGGAGGVKDAAGNPMASDFSWAFTTSASSADEAGSGGPILIIASESDPFTRYTAEILLAEGLNAFAVRDISSVTATELDQYDVAVLGQMPLTAAQVNMFSAWVNAGGNLVAMRPDKQLAGLLGLVDIGMTLAEGYLLVDTSSGPGMGIVGQTIQFHGTADRYALGSAAALATLYVDATTATSSPAVTLRSVGSNGGQAAAFTFDLARSVVYTRQGNPAWAGQERDGISPIRSNDLFYGDAAGDPQPDWIDLNKIAIPQADEQQRLLANLIIRMNIDRKPLPRFWYFPGEHEAVLVMTGDDHGGDGTVGRFEAEIAASPSGCSVDDWECIRSSSYLYPDPVGLLSDALASAYDAGGFEIGIHINSGCSDYTAESLELFFSDQMADWFAQFPSLPPPVSHRIHCISWSGYTTLPEEEANYGIRFDVNYYYWPSSWVANRPGFFTGSGMPMRFAAEDGTLIDVYQAATQMTDESGQAYPYTVDTLLDQAIGPEKYYGVFTANMHTDYATFSDYDALIASALERGVPIVSARQMLTWLDGRNGSSFSSLAWNGADLAFTVSAAPGANGLQVMVPKPRGLDVTYVNGNGNPVGYTVRIIKGLEYVIFYAAGGDYEVGFIVDAAPPTILVNLPLDGAVDVNISKVSVTFNEAMDPATIDTTTFELRDEGNNLVPAAVAYESSTNTASLTPLAPLAESTTYTATVLGGAAGVTDIAGNPLAADYSWLFTTAEAGPAILYSLWDDTVVPTILSSEDTNAVELGVKFQSSVDGYITGLRFYKAADNTGTHVGNLWTAGGTLLASVTFTNESASGWQGWHCWRRWRLRPTRPT